MGLPICIVLTSVASSEDAGRLAGALVEQGLAACVQCSAPGSSIYRWQGSIEASPEIYLTIKTRPELVDAAVQWLTCNHPYEVPELVVLDGEASLAYGLWLTEATAAPIYPPTE